LRREKLHVTGEISGRYRLKPTCPSNAVIARWRKKTEGVSSKTEGESRNVGKRKIPYKGKKIKVATQKGTGMIKLKKKGTRFTSIAKKLGGGGKTLKKREGADHAAGWKQKN